MRYSHKAQGSLRWNFSSPLEWKRAFNSAALMSAGIVEKNYQYTMYFMTNKDYIYLPMRIRFATWVMLNGKKMY